jgi:ABC-type transport system involved in multi-copper enzyme maturation permease subunit
VEVLMLVLVPVLMHKYPDNVLFMAAMLTVGPSLAAIGAVFFSADAIAGEFESKTGFLLFTNPLKRHILWIGKYLAGLVAVILLIVFTYVIISVSLFAIYQQVPVQILGSFGLCVLYGAAVLSLTYFFSALSKGTMGATVMTLLFIWVISGIVESILGFTNKPYWFMISAGGDSIAMPYGSIKDLMTSFGMSGNMGTGFGSFTELSIPLAVCGMLIYLVVGFVVSIWVSRRRQLA